jgi:hypothetical protein
MFDAVFDRRDQPWRLALFGRERLIDPVRPATRERVFLF